MMMVQLHYILLLLMVNLKYFAVTLQVDPQVKDNVAESLSMMLLLTVT